MWLIRLTMRATTMDSTKMIHSPSPLNQSTNQSNNHSMGQSTVQSTNQPTNQSTDQSTILSWSHQTNETSRQSTILKVQTSYHLTVRTIIIKSCFNSQGARKKKLAKLKVLKNITSSVNRRIFLALNWRNWYLTPNSIYLKH